MNNRDQDVIDYIASVSKHPHAVMIVEWLITGWDVSKRGWNEKLENPIWSPNVEYELIKPKPPKPAYRVYKSGSLTFTVDRYIDGRCSYGNDPDLDWLTDWIEYDQDPDAIKWPTPLCERIAAIDLQAAKWIVGNWDNLLDDNYTLNSYNRESSTLVEMFYWAESPQGIHYWEEMSNKLGE